MIIQILIKCQGEANERTVYVAITGTNHYYGTEFIKVGQIVHLTKDPDNPHDQEAIKAEIMPLGKIGYVANSTHTVPRGCRSAGRIYDTFITHICGIVRFVVKDTVILELAEGVEEVYIVTVKSDDLIREEVQRGIAHD
ncbi:HIRAN domain-containing protein [Effusibacillus lacus]|uniref:DNA-binding protein n=1 Tax=Effusibacillus lacus TaxID=1348429 RepID=A0A292YDE2_9BACL|nr:HIRAN domain-containing protein [Effusibacillus lacus]TCS66185.1 HIRAN domain-containing protein [Effusibacillus lacus]GAX90042.1 DNA-binding protein [Effusibacillus lacus]